MSSLDHALIAATTSPRVTSSQGGLLPSNVQFRGIVVVVVVQFVPLHRVVVVLVVDDDIVEDVVVEVVVVVLPTFM